MGVAPSSRAPLINFSEPAAMIPSGVPSRIYRGSSGNLSRISPKHQYAHTTPVPLSRTERNVRDSIAGQERKAGENRLRSSSISI